MGAIALLLGLLGLPIGVSLWLTRTEHSPPGRFRWGVSLAAGTTALCALGLIARGAPTFPFKLVWLPEAGPMGLSLGVTSLYAIAATASAAAVAFLIAAPSSRRPRFLGGLVLVALAAGNLAFLSGHFLMRYVALETVGLCVAAVQLLEGEQRDRFFHAGWVYLLLRIGDAGLLVGVLLLRTFSGTLEIGPALEAGGALPAAAQLWVIGGLYLAVAVKIGLWPFQRWIASGARLSRDVHAGLYATLMPNLGLYLLYRVSPLLAAAPSLRPVVFGVGALSGAVALLSIVRRPAASRPSDVNALLGSVIWCATSVGTPKIAWWGLLAMSFVRLPLFLTLPRPAKAPSGDLAARWADGGEAHQMVRRLSTRVEKGGLERGVAALWAAGQRLARGLYAHLEINTFDRGLETLAQRTLAATANVHATLEQQGLEGALRAVARGVLRGSHLLRHRHSGRLRANLRWIVLCIILAVAWAIFR